MSQEKIKVQIITPEKTGLSLSCSMIVLPAIEGEIGIMYGHQELITYLKSGLIKIFDSEENIQAYFIQSGSLNVVHDKVTILTEKFISIESVTSNELKEIISNLENLLSNTANNSEKLILTAEIDFNKELMTSLATNETIENAKTISN